MNMQLHSSIESTFVPLQILENYEKISKQNIKLDWKNKSESELWHELCFCILSANVNYDLAKSTLNHLVKHNFLNPDWFVFAENSQKKIETEFEKSVYLPKKKDNTLRKYRYPKKRSEQIIKAGIFLYKKNNGIKDILSKFDNPVDSREFLVSNISGIGIKEASHYLRNIGYCNSLAIIDVHVLAFLENILLTKFRKNKSLSDKMYLFLEKILVNFSKFHNLTLSILDMAIWHYMRSKII